MEIEELRAKKKGSKAETCRLSFVFFPMLLSFSTSSFVCKRRSVYECMSFLRHKSSNRFGSRVANRIFEFSSFACIHEKYSFARYSCCVQVL
jgi:hypothetical protein